MVQFHPSYTYEQFVEGLRPVLDQGAFKFDIVPGMVKRVVENIARRPGRRVVLIVEMNRANLPKVLGAEVAPSRGRCSARPRRAPRLEEGVVG